MKKRWLVLPILIAFAVLVVWLEPTRVVWGALRGQAFYQGRPTGYWARELDRWDSYTIELVGGMAVPTGFWQHWYTWFGRGHPDEPPAILAQDPAVLPVLFELLDDDRASVRYHAVSTLSALDCWDVQVGSKPVLTLLSHARPDVRWYAAIALGNSGEPEFARAVPALLEAVRDGDAEAQERALDTLAKMGPAARAAVPALLELASVGGPLHDRACVALQAVAPDIAKAPGR